MLKLYLDPDFFLILITTPLPHYWPSSKAHLKSHLDMCFTLVLHILMLSSAGLFIFKVRLCTKTLCSSTCDKGKKIIPCAAYESKKMNSSFFLKSHKNNQWAQQSIIPVSGGLRIKPRCHCTEYVGFSQQVIVEFGIDFNTQGSKCYKLSYLTARYSGLKGQIMVFRELGMIGLDGLRMIISSSILRPKTRSTKSKSTKPNDCPSCCYKTTMAQISWLHLITYAITYLPLKTDCGALP